MVRDKLYYLVGLLLSFIFSNFCYSQSRYFICGPDEDGCSVEQVKHCVCIPYDESNYSRPYCLNFDKMQCEPLINLPNCPSTLIYEDQGSCLATIFQSEPEPPCPTVSEEFCMVNHITLCDVNGDPLSCRAN